MSRDKKKCRQCTILETVLAETQKRCEKKERENKIADKVLKCRTVDNPVRENFLSDDGIEIYYQDDTTSW